MTPELFDKLKDIKTKQAGWTIARAINTGTLYPSSFVGCHAGDVESYEVFKELFNPVIEAYHKGFKMDGSMSHVTKMDASLITETVDEGTKSKVISTRIRVARNLTFVPLNPGGTKQTRLEVASTMEKVFAGIKDEDLKGKFYRHTTMSDK